MRNNYQELYDSIRTTSGYTESNISNDLMKEFHTSAAEEISHHGLTPLRRTLTPTIDELSTGYDLDANNIIKVVGLYVNGTQIPSRNVEDPNDEHVYFTINGNTFTVYNLEQFQEADVAVTMRADTRYMPDFAEPLDGTPEDLLLTSHSNVLIQGIKWKLFEHTMQPPQMELHYTQFLNAVKQGQKNKVITYRTLRDSPGASRLPRELT